MPPLVPKRCPTCGARCTKTGENLAYWLCPNCGWTDDPSVLQPLDVPIGAAADAVTDPAPETQ